MSDVISELEQFFGQLAYDIQVLIFGQSGGGPPPPPPPGQPANWALTSSADSSSPPDQIAIPGSVIFTVLVTDVNGTPVPNNAGPLYVYQDGLVLTSVTVPSTDANGMTQFTIMFTATGSYDFFVSPALQ